MELFRIQPDFKDVGSQGSYGQSTFIEVVLLEQSQATPLLYQLKRNNLTPIESIERLKEELRTQKDAFHILDEVKEIKSDRKTIILRDGTVISYKFLILVTGYQAPTELGSVLPALKDALILDCLKVQEKMQVSPKTTPQSKQFLSLTLCALNNPEMQKIIDGKLASNSKDANWKPNMVTKRSLQVQMM